jgi:hypothetical protein
MLGRLRLGIRDERLGQPRADVALAANARRTEVVDREPRRGRSEVRLRRLDLRTVLDGALEADERLLDDVLGLGDAAEHAVRDREEQRPQLLEDLCGVHGHVLQDEGTSPL